MRALFGGGFDYARGGLALMGLGMGFHLFAGTLNQAALARGRGRGVGGGADRTRNHGTDASAPVRTAG